jgi:succinylglutamic semialdehyde dehydrogenase
MTDNGCFIEGTWRPGSGQTLTSLSPADGRVVWTGPEATADDVADAIAAARCAQPGWEATSLAERRRVMETFADLVQRRAEELADVISAETGKPRWEAATEVGSVIGKVRLAVDAHAERTPDVSVSDTASLRHRPLGVIGVLGPFNFPAHLPNGQIIPALLAGNSVVYKPSEQTPAVAAVHIDLLTEAGVPAGVLNMIAGARDAGAALVDGSVDGIAFTGSVATGRALHRALADRPEVLLALEMGGNNPLVVADIADIESAVNVIIRSAFITAGQRCTCARRLYVPRGAAGDDLLTALVETTRRLRIGAPDDDPEPFAGPVISPAAAANVRRHVDAMASAGATALTGPGEAIPGTGFVRPTILDCDRIEIPDEEVFGPVLAVQRYDRLDDAFAAAADTAYGLAAGLIGSDPDDFARFQMIVRAGLVNWNAPTTGASGRLPFGGVGASGNHRPAGWMAADFCAFPVATVAQRSTIEASAPIRGIEPSQPNN